MGGKATKAATQPAKPASGGAPPGVDPNASVDELKQNMADLRGDLRRWLAAVGAVASAAMAGLGWTQADKLFPLPGPWGVPFVAAMCAAAIIIGALVIFVRLYSAQRRILVGLEPIGRDGGLTPAEVTLVEKQFKEQAKTEQALLLRDLQARADRLDRAATRLDVAGNQLAPKVRQEADRLNTYVGIAQRRVGVLLLEQRARRATSSHWTVAALATAAFGIAGMFATANYASGYRASHAPSPAAKATACLDAIAKSTYKGNADLQAACVKLIAP